MLKYTKQFLQKRKVMFLLCAIILVGGFLRLYNVGEWMHYELDQARDYRVIHTAIEQGPSYLPLQGPRAAGNVDIDETDELGYGGKTTLRLGPLFYYIEYISALIFGDTPTGSIMLITLLSIAAIPLFYFFLCEFFRTPLSLGLTALFAASLFFVSYSRFGWNPNLIPFFTLTLFYALLRVTRYTREHKTQRGWWLIVASGSFAFLAHMHFLAFIAAPIIAVSYLLWTRPRISLSFWVSAILLFIVLNVPLIVNDIKTNGENTKAFVASLRSSQDGSHSLPEKVMKNISEHARYNWIMLSGNQQAELPLMKDGAIFCDDGCKQGLFYGIVSGLTIVAGILGGFWFYRTTHSRRHRNFLRLSFLWGCIVFLMYIPLAYDFAGRFFLLHAPLSIIVIGMIIQGGLARGKRRDVVLGKIIIGLLIVSNLALVGVYFRELHQSQRDATFTLMHKDYILGEKTRMTLGQIEDVTRYIIAIHHTNGFPIFLHGQSEFKRTLWERIDTQVIPRADIPGDMKPIYREGNYFLVLRSQANHDKHLEDFLAVFDVKEEKTFGTLTLFHFTQKEDSITDERAVIPMAYHDPRFSDSAQVRYLWHQVFSGCRYSYETDLCEK